MKVMVYYTICEVMCGEVMSLDKIRIYPKERQGSTSLLRMLQHANTPAAVNLLEYFLNRHFTELPMCSRVLH